MIAEFIELPCVLSGSLDREERLPGDMVDVFHGIVDLHHALCLLLRAAHNLR